MTVAGQYVEYKGGSGTGNLIVGKSYEVLEIYGTLAYSTLRIKVPMKEDIVFEEIHYSGYFIPKTKSPIYQIY